jgi:hypothetical protein
LTQSWDPGDFLGTDMGYGDSYQWRVVARRTACPTYAGLASDTYRFTTVGDFEARRLESGDYAFGFVLYNSETARVSAFSEVAQVRDFEFEADEETISLYAAMEIVYDSDKFDQAWIYRSVKVQDAGGTYIAAILHLDAIINLSDYHTVNNGVGEAFPPTQDFRQAIYYYQLEDKQLVQKEPFVGHNIFDEQMPQGGCGMMFHGSLMVSKIEGSQASSGDEIRPNDAYSGRGEIRWSSSQYFSPELFPPLNRAEPETPSNEVISLRKAGHNGLGFSNDRMYHLRKEGDTVRMREIHKGYGLVNHHADEEVGSVIFFVSEKGLKTVDAFAKLDEYHVLDEVIINRWRNTQSRISVAHDPMMGALFILNPDGVDGVHGEGMVLWFNTAMVTSLDDMNFDKVVRGAWPRDIDDFDDTLVSRAFFLKNVPYDAAFPVYNGMYTSGLKPQVMVVDQEREKTTTFYSVGGDPAIRMLETVGVPWATVVTPPMSGGVGEWEFDVNVPTGIEGGYMYLVQHAPGYDAAAGGSAIGSRFRVYGLGDGSEPTKLWVDSSNVPTTAFAALLAGAVVVFSPVKVDIRMPALGLVGEDGTPFSGLEFHRQRQVDSIGAVMVDVLQKGSILVPYVPSTLYDRYYATLYRGSSEEMLERTWPRNLDGNDVVSVQENEGTYFAAYGADQTELLDGKVGVQGTVLIPGFETFTPDMDYRLLSLLVTGKILDTERRTQPEI